LYIFSLNYIFSFFWDIKADFIIKTDKPLRYVCFLGYILISETTDKLEEFMKRINILLVILAASLLYFKPVAAVTDPIEVNAKSYILIDTRTGQVLCEYNADERLYPASTTKIMTAILALENGRLDQVMTASAEACYDIGKDGMNIGIIPDEKLVMEDLINAMLIQSANETANIIAENLAGSRQEFVDMMNRKAEELGAGNTHFTNPCGAHDDNHYTTARDMSKIALYAMTIPEFREIVKKESYEMSPTNKHPSWDTLLYSTNKLLRNPNTNKFKVTGIKTGYTNPAGYCLVASAEKDGLELISVVMGVDPSQDFDSVFKYSRTLLEYGFDNFGFVEIVKEGKVVGSVTVNNGDKDVPLNVLTADNITVLAKITGGGPVVKEEKFIRPLKAPVNKGDIVGYAEYWVDGVKAGKINLIAENNVYKAAAPDIPLLSVEEVKDSAVPSFLKIIAYVLLTVVVLFLILKIIVMIHNRKVRRRRLYH